MKEDDHLKMLGVLPSQGADPIPVSILPDGGTQVAKHRGASNTTVVIHTVTTGKTLYLSSFIYSARNDNVANEYAYLFVTDGDDTPQYYLNDIALLPTNQLVFSVSFNPPLEIIAGWMIKIRTYDAGCAMMAFIHGYEA